VKQPFKKRLNPELNRIKFSSTKIGIIYSSKGICNVIFFIKKASINSQVLLVVTFLKVMAGTVLPPQQPDRLRR
jgi:hypothetical protein